MRATSERWFRLLLRLYPSDFRDEMGESLVEAYRDRCRKAEASIAVASRIEPHRFVLVEPVFVVDERRKPDQAGEQAARHHRIERAPIIAEHEIEAAKIAGEPPEPPDPVPDPCL